MCASFSRPGESLFGIGAGAKRIKVITGKIITINIVSQVKLTRSGRALVIDGNGEGDSIPDGGCFRRTGYRLNGQVRAGLRLRHLTGIVDREVQRVAKDCQRHQKYDDG